MQHIGMQIRKLRKERKLTLQQLAGDRLTKGMLSLIENGKAQPSMESLQYIASQLGVHVTSLMNDETSQRANDLLKQLEAAVESYNYLSTEAEREALRQEKIVSLAPFIEASHFTTFEEVEIYYYYASYYTLSYDDCEEHERLLRDVMTHYERFNAASHVVRCYFRIMEIHFAHYDYERSYAVMEEAQRYIESHAFHVDIMRKIDVYYYTVVLASALGKHDVSAAFTEKILTLCKENRLYYETNELYRIRFSESLTTNPAQAYYFLEKMEQFATFTEDATEQSFAQLMRITYLIHVEQAYDQALTLIDNMTYSDIPVYRELAAHSIQGLRGLLYYYKQQYDVALSYLESYWVHKKTPYPLDICGDYLMFAVKGVCYIELGRTEDGEKEIVYAYEQTKHFVPNIYQTQIAELYTQYVHIKRSAR